MSIDRQSNDITPVSEQQGEQGTPKEKVNHVSGTRKKPDRQTRNTGKKGAKSAPIEIPTLESIEDLMEGDEPLQPIVESSPNKSKDIYDKADQHENAIKKLESRGVPQEIQEKLGLKWIPKKKATDDYYNFTSGLVSPWGVILIPYTFTHIDGFNGQAYNFYPTDEIQKQETEKRTLKGYDKQPKYLNPKGSKRQDYPVYDPYLLMNPEDKGKKVFMITEDTFGVILAAIQGYRCWSSRLGVSLISNDEIILLGKDGKKKTEIVNKLGQEEPVITSLMNHLGYKVPWFPDNDWVSKPNVWTETIKTSVYLELKIGVFPLSDTKTGLDEYVKSKGSFTELVDYVCELDEFINEFTSSCKFKVKRESVALAILGKKYDTNGSTVLLLQKFPTLKEIIKEIYAKIEDQLLMEKALNDLFVGKARMNLMGHELEFTENRDVDLESIKSWLSEHHEISFDTKISVTAIQDHLLYIGRKDKYNPMKEYLVEMAEKYQDETLESVGNIAKLFLGSDDPLHDVIFKKAFFFSVISRTFNPGCFVKAALVLTGKQSAAKTSFFRTILPKSNWAVSDVSSVTSKDDLMKCQKAVVVEWGEVAKIMRKNDREEVKNFMTLTEDLFRPPYGRRSIFHPRHFTIVASTNDEELLTDKNDHTRFKIIKLAQDWVIPLNVVRQERDRIWGVLTNYWLDLTPDEREEMLRYSELEDRASYQASEDFRVQDAFEAPVLEFCYKRAIVYMHEILLHLDVRLDNKSVATRIGNLLKEQGWVRKRKGSGDARTYFHINPNAIFEKGYYKLPKSKGEAVDEENDPC